MGRLTIGLALALAAGALLLGPLSSSSARNHDIAFALSVSVTGEGRVTSVPAGIACPGNCSHVYSASTIVKLSAYLVRGNAFQGWGGACSGSSFTCEIEMSSNKSVTATFVAKPPPPPPPPPPTTTSTTPTSTAPTTTTPTTPSPTPPSTTPTTTTTTPVTTTVTPPTPGGCEKGVICFDDLPAGSMVKDQYASQGVELGVAPIDNTGGVGAVPSIAKDPLARSDGQVGALGPCNKENCPSATVYGHFPKRRKWVQVYVGGGQRVSLVARSVGFEPIAGASATVQTAPGTLTLLRVEAKTYRIAYFELGQDAPIGSQRGRLVLDDLSFSPPDPNAKPGFALLWEPQKWEENGISVPLGGSATTKVSLTRFGGSNGDVTLTATAVASTGAAPTGITATVSPSVAATSTSWVTVTVNASPRAVVPPNSHILVIGHPAVPSAGAQGSDAFIPFDVRLSNYDVVTTGIEVTQGIQEQQTPYYSGSVPAALCDLGANLKPPACSSTLFDKNVCATQPSLPARDMTNLAAPLHYKVGDPAALAPEWLLAPYRTPDENGVVLVANRKTVVRVFASLAGAGKALAAPPALLYGTRKGEPLSGSPLSPDFSPRLLVSSPYPWVTCQQRSYQAGAYTFTLPDSWTKGNTTLEAMVVPDTLVFGAGAECGSKTCADDNDLKLQGVAYTPLAYTTVTPVAVFWQPTSENSSSGIESVTPGQAFSFARYAMPDQTYFSDGSSATSYAGILDLTNLMSSMFLLGDDAKETGKIRCSAVTAVLEDWADDNAIGDQVVAVLPTTDQLCPGQTDGGRHLIGDHVSFHAAQTKRRDTIAHEMLHGVGRPHADLACGGDSNGQVGEPWPPDQRGHIHGIGLDTRAGSGGNLGLFGPYRVLVPGGVLNPAPATQPTEWVDIMSYCWKNFAVPGFDASVWFSDRGWNDTVRLLEDFQRNVHRLADAPGRRLEVTAILSPKAVAIVTVKVGRPSGHDGSGTVSPYEVVALDDSGRTLSTTPMRFYLSHTDGVAVMAGVLRADAPAISAAKIEIVLHGAVVASRSRSASAPKVRVRLPRAGARVGAGKKVVVAWTMTDADHDPIQAKVDYSLDGGGTWRALLVGSMRSRVVLPSSFFAGSRRARVRVRVSDGFNETAAESGIFTAVGRPPSVHILSPVRGQRFPGDGSIYLEGESYDDRGAILRGAHLVWFDGRRMLGVGERLSVTGLPPGVRRLRLHARDARGRSADAAVRVRVFPAVPHLLLLEAPDVLARRSRKLVVRIATTIPARLAVAGLRRSVGRRPRALTIPVRPGRRRLVLRLRLSSGPSSHTVELVIRRR